jgi:hypothetical protein
MATSHLDWRELKKELFTSPRPRTSQTFIHSDIFGAKGTAEQIERNNPTNQANVGKSSYKTPKKVPTPINLRFAKTILLVPSYSTRARPNLNDLCAHMERKPTPHVLRYTRATRCGSARLTRTVSRTTATSGSSSKHVVVASEP